MAFFLVCQLGDKKVTKQVFVRAVESRYKVEAEAAVYRGLKRRTLQNMRWNGKGPAYLKRGVKVFYLLEDLEAWSNERSVRKTSTSDPGIPV
jgi:Helix-turn-helix domain